MNVSVILVAAGHGRRFGPRHQRPKQFKTLLGKPLLCWPLRLFEKTPSVNSVVLVVSADYMDFAKTLVRRERFKKVVAVTQGGKERADSVRRGFARVPAGTDVVLVHDSARALVSKEIVERVISAVDRRGAALAAIPVPDTVKKASRDGLIRKTIPRDGLWLAQTPQGFRFELAKKIFTADAKVFTDDVQWAERAGHPVEIVMGSPMNFKVTVPEDFKLCEAVLKGKA